MPLIPRAVVASGGMARLDRLVATLVERKAAQYLFDSLGPQARIRVLGPRFAPQLASGRYTDVHVSGAELRLGTMVGARLDAHLVNAYLPLRALLRGRAGELSVERVHGNIVVPYTELGRVSPVPGLRLDFRDGRLIVSAAVPLLGISALARVSGEAVVWVGDRGGVRLRVRDIALAGMSVPAIVLNRIVPAIGFPIPLPPLPFGLRIERLTPIQDGLQVSGSANEVVFRRRADPE